MSDFKIFYYDGIPIRFELGDDSVMMCATELGKQFGRSKKPHHWLKTKRAKKAISAIAEATKLRADTLIRVQYGGIVPGTWMHSDVAIEYARWLSPKFGAWCTTMIKSMILDMDKRVMDDKRVDVVDVKFPNRCYMEVLRKDFIQLDTIWKKIGDYLNNSMRAIWKFYRKIIPLTYLGHGKDKKR